MSAIFSLLVGKNASRWEKYWRGRFGSECVIPRKSKGNWGSSIGSRDGAKVKSVPDKPRETADVVVVSHGALRCVRGVATIDTRVLLVAEVFVVAVVES